MARKKSLLEWGPKAPSWSSPGLPPHPFDGTPWRSTSESVLEADASEHRGFPIVGLGTTEGGLAGFEAFFFALPPNMNLGMAFVLRQNLSPDDQRALSDLIQRHTRLAVSQARNGMRITVNRAIIIPAHQEFTFFNGTLQLQEGILPRNQRMPLNVFFRSLALDQRERAVGVVLGGDDREGLLGLKAVKDEGGLAMVQVSESAEFDPRPRLVMAPDFEVDRLSPSGVSGRLMDHAAGILSQGTPVEGGPDPDWDQALKKICVLIRYRTGHDFSHYKPSTVIRRVERRLAFHHLVGVEHYLSYLENSPDEVQTLFQDLLIGVTNFFRDPEAFAVLGSLVIPRIFSGKQPGDTIRVWVCGCSTGEEAYSIAILCQEYLESSGLHFGVRIMATDIDPQALTKAQTGTFPGSIASDMAPERLKRFFIKEPVGEGFRIRKNIRALVDFMEMDLIEDSPFCDLDLISCRNLLIYLDGAIQKKIIPKFHSALNPDGVLFLGTSETVGESSMIFSPLCRKWKIFKRQEDKAGLNRPVRAPICHELLSGS